VSKVPQPSCFLAEWYRPEVTSRMIEDMVAMLDAAAATMRAEGMQVRLLFTLAVPTDEVLYGMFSAYSAEAVVLTCDHAGIPIERLSSDVLLGSVAPQAGGPGPAVHPTG
jgi:hypothetical protein